jgi:hypothetical protein
LVAKNIYVREKNNIQILQEKARKQSGEPADNRSFLAKYWMYIVPVFIFLAINSAAGPEAAR